MNPRPFPHNLWPHGAYAEDQRFHHGILATHVMFRGFQAGSLLGSMIGPIGYMVRRRTLPTRPLLAPLILRSSGVGALFGTGLMGILLPLRMWGREEIEWKDRSWRLLENPGQMEVDGWSGLAALVVGTAAAVRKKRLGSRIMADESVSRSRRLVAFRGSWVMVVGAAGMGSMLGLASYLAWRYGLHGGKWPEN